MAVSIVAESNEDVDTQPADPSISLVVPADQGDDLSVVVLAGGEQNGLTGDELSVTVDGNSITTAEVEGEVGAAFADAVAIFKADADSTTGTITITGQSSRASTEMAIRAYCLKADGGGGRPTVKATQLGSAESATTASAAVSAASGDVSLSVISSGQVRNLSVGTGGDQTEDAEIDGGTTTTSWGSVAVVGWLFGRSCLGLERFDKSAHDRRDYI